MNPKFKYYFTITAGRTGTGWLASFLGQNLQSNAIHEPLGIDDFGVNMPDIKIMRSFNERGNNDLVREFWKTKFDRISQRPLYIETNHTLAKCGLVENLDGSVIAKDSALIILKRNRVDLCLSYIIRGDFSNITLIWQWYLNPAYPNNLVNPEPFLNLGQIGPALWYTYEMNTRQQYYLRRYAGKLNFIEVSLEDITSPPSAHEFLKNLGWEGNLIMPPPVNENLRAADKALVDKVKHLVTQFDFDLEGIVKRHLEIGRTLA